VIPRTVKSLRVVWLSIAGRADTTDEATADDSRIKIAAVAVSPSTGWIQVLDPSFNAFGGRMHANERDNPYQSPVRHGCNPDFDGYLKEPCVTKPLLYEALFKTTKKTHSSGTALNRGG
jgi:hypothetical protein